jgi:hypothetical protein
MTVPAIEADALGKRFGRATHRMTARPGAWATPHTPAHPASRPPLSRTSCLRNR